MRIALDAMGSDSAPSAEVAGAVAALQQVGTEVREVILVGDEQLIRDELGTYADTPVGIRVHHAPDRVTAEDSPASAVRRKPESSIAVGLKLHRDREADAFVSAGSTGAVMASSLFILRPIPGVDRPPVGTLLPTAGELSLLLDAGANVGCKPRHLVQFAHLGSTYMRDAMGRPNPRVGLLNIGEEPGKGDDLTVEAYSLLTEAAGVNFVGNIEGRDIVRGECDVIVCDGFVGNVLLKFYESVAGYIVDLLRSEIGPHAGAEVDLERVWRMLDYAEYGGAPLLGVGGVSIICHGSSSPKAIQNALIVAARAARSGLVTNTAEEFDG